MRRLTVSPYFIDNSVEVISPFEVNERYYKALLEELYYQYAKRIECKTNTKSLSGTTQETY